MRADVGDRLVLHGRRGTRIGVVTEVTDGDADSTSRVQWADGGESVLTAGPEPAESPTQAAWNRAKDAGSGMKWRKGVTAGLGWEASQALAKLSKEPAAESAAEAAEAPPVEHNPAAGE